jgi:DNA-directed RNA polymerase subunit RPC12/RpoP
MKKAIYICKDCGQKFEVLVYEPGEAEEKGERGGPVRCKHCRSHNVERM